mmetsp:Transcript_33519/g.50555  ORF Transcript_33519/g.50555 Transcript_33519/m.50555 type:complete len:124 (+) Transcript_33519:631-1002(+)
MLAERQRDLHRKIATILEGEETDKVVELRHAMKVFGHWRGSGNLMNSTRLALKIGQYLDGLLFNRQSMDFCIEALEMWKPAKLQNKDDTGLIAGKKFIHGFCLCPCQKIPLANISIIALTLYF